MNSGDTDPSRRAVMVGATGLAAAVAGAGTGPMQRGLPSANRHGRLAGGGR
jgi:hypothetical protein